MRVLSSSEPIPIDKLDLTPRNLREIKKIAEKPYGLILCVGPTGSGKTTTLHSLMGHINKPERKIWTAEDPVEITQYGLRQVQVMPKIGFDFAAAMRAFLRADPDVIMVGEMRDEETASTGIEASLTGHLVFSTLHTNSAVGDGHPPARHGAATPSTSPTRCSASWAQRLVKRICPDCKSEYHPDRAEYDELAQAFGEESFATLNLRVRRVVRPASRQGLRLLLQDRLPRAPGDPRADARERRDEAPHPDQSARGRDARDGQG